MKKKTCKKCDASFAVRNYNQIFCSDECRNAYHNEIKAEAIRRYREVLKSEAKT